MKKSLILALFIVVTAAGNALAADGVLNMDAVVANYPAFRQAQEQIVKLAQNTEAQLKSEKDASKQQQIQRQFITQQQQIMAPVIEKVKTATEKVAKSKKLDMVHSALTTYYGGVDITNDVIAALK